jgi:predicted PurR-regulated permease PerM
MMALFRYAPSIIASAIILFLFYLLFLIFQPFITALILSAVMVILFHPIHKQINHKLPKTLASLVSTLLVFLIIIIPGLLIATGIAREAIALNLTIPGASFENIMNKVHTLAGKFNLDLDFIIKSLIQKIASQAGELSLHVIGNVWNIMIGIFVTLLATFFFFRDGERAMHLVKLFPFNSSWIENLIHEIVIMIKANISASFIAASIQGTIAGLTFAWLNIPAPILWGTIMGFFSIFPFIGSWLVWIPVAGGLALAGQFHNAILLIIIGLAVVNPVDNILRPTIVGSYTRINGLLIFIALLGGVQAFGVSGLLIGPIIMILLTGLLTINPK